MHAAEGVLEVTRAELRQGRLDEAFRAGASAVVLVDDPRVEALWRTLVERPDEPSPTAQVGAAARERLPWEAPLADVARNHLGSNSDLESQLGDQVRCVPGGIGFVARKVELSRADGTFVTTPAQFKDGATTYQLPTATLATIWELASDIWRSLMPQDTGTSYCATLERLKYSDDLNSFAELARMLHASGGRWSVLGHRIDVYVETMRRFTDHRLACQALALLCLVPWLRPALERRAAARAETSPKYGNLAGGTIIGHPHTDGRFVNCLCGARDALRTEILTRNGWIEMPMSPSKLSIIPGSQLTALNGVPATIHRVVHTEREVNGDKPSWCNVTLVFGLKSPSSS